MSYKNAHILVDNANDMRSTRYPIWVYIAIPLACLLIQVYLPLFQTLHFVSRIELPLLVTVYFALMSRSQIRGLMVGMLLGLAQDSFSRYYIGMYGICKTISGYFSASIGMQFDVENSMVRLVMCFVFYLFHQFLYWVLQRALLDQPFAFDMQAELILAGVNALIGVVLFRALDYLRKTD
jgi:rod shape-determining protein MreD